MKAPQKKKTTNSADISSLIAVKNTCNGKLVLIPSRLLPYMDTIDKQEDNISFL